MDLSLNSPITDIELHYVKCLVRSDCHLTPPPYDAIPSFIRKTVASAGPEIQHLLDTSEIMTADHIPSLIRHGGSSTLKMSLLQEAHNAAEVSYSQQVRGIADQLEGDSIGLFKRQEFQLPNFSPSCLVHFFRSSCWQTLVTLISNKQLRTRVGWKEVEVEGIKLVHNGGILLLIIQAEREDTRPLLLSWDMLLMIKDATFSRFLCSMAIDFQSRRTEASLSQDDLGFILSWQERCLSQYGNRGFKIVKSIEPVVKGAIILGTDEVAYEGSVMERMVKKVEDKEKEIHPRGLCPRIVELRDFLLDNSSRIEALGELFGTMKLSGHPTVDPIAGAQGAKKIAKEDIYIRPRDARALRATFCHMFCRGFITAKNRWPRISFLRQDKDTRISSLERLYSRSGRLNLVADNYDMKDWNFCRFGKEYNFDTGEDFLELISDKAISPVREEVWSSWKGTVPVPVPNLTTSRRALLQLLNTPSFVVDDITRQVSTRTIGLKHKIVCVYPKEREMKDDPRMFAMMTLEMRTFFVNTEHNIAQGIFQHIPQQTMTMRRVDLVKRLYEMTNPPKIGYIRLNVESDFERWNLKWRPSVVNPIARDFNDLYGVKGVFDYTHEFFKSAIVVLRHPSLPPEQEAWDQCPDLRETRVSWLDHEGGFEGISQKVWTTPTLAIVYQALAPLGLEFTLAGQADNQVITVLIPWTKVPDGMTLSQATTYWSKTITREIEASATRVGQTVKPEECVESRGFVSYGKELLAKGVFLPSTIKQLSRVFPSCNTVQPSLMEYLSSISSGCLAAAEKSDDALCCFRVCQVVTALTLYRELTFSAFHGDNMGLKVNFPDCDLKRRREIVATLLVWPRNLGGIDSANLVQFMYKNPTDPLSASLASVKMSSSWGIESNRVLRCTAACMFLSKAPSVTALVSDPYSIPLNRPLDPSSAAFGKVRDTLEGVTENAQILALIRNSRPEDRDIFMEVICSQRPFYPKVTHDIYDSTHFATLDKFAKRFTSTRTLVDIATKSGEFSALMTISSDSRLLTKILLDLLDMLRLVEFPNLQNIHIYQLATQLRERWGVGLLQGVTTIHPSEFGRVQCVTKIEELCHKSRKGYVVSRMECTGASPLFSSRGPFLPYLGSSTASRLVQRGVSVINPSPPLRAAIKVITLRNMISSPGSSLWELLNEIALSRCDLSLPELEAISPRRIGGVIAHRHQIGLMEEGAHLNTLPNASSHFTFSSDHCGEMAEGTANYPSSFQDIYLHIGSTVTLNMNQDIATSHTFILCTDVDSYPTIEDQLVSLTFQGTYHMQDLPFSYYLRADLARFSGGVESSLRWKGREHLHGVIGNIGPRDLALAIEEVVVVSLTRRREVRRAMTGQGSGQSLSCPIDIPELRRLSLDEVLDGYSLAMLETVFFGGVLSSSTYREFIKQTLDRLYLLCNKVHGLLAPAIRTISHHSGCPYLLRPRLGKGGESSFQKACATILYDRCEEMLTRVTHDEDLLSWLRPHRIYEDSMHSESSAYTSAILKFCICSTNVRDDRVWLFIRHLARHLLKMRSCSSSEDQLLLDIGQLLKKLNIPPSCIEVYPGLPEDIIRQIRDRPEYRLVGQGLPPKRNKLFDTLNSIPKVQVVKRDCHLSGSFLVLPLFTQSLKSLVLSHLLRPTTVLSSSFYVWLPVLRHLSGTVIVIGVGSGGFVRMVHSLTDLHVIGTETASNLSQLGHTFVDYYPPEVEDHTRYKTLKSSWITSGMIEDENFILEIRTLISTLEGNCTLIIDVEGVENSSRLSLFSLLSREKTKGVGVKIYSDEAHTSLLRANLVSANSDSLDWWPTATYPHHETCLFTTGEAPKEFLEPLSLPEWVYDTTSLRQVAIRLSWDFRRDAIDQALTVVLTDPPVTTTGLNPGPLELSRVTQESARLGKTRHKKVTAGEATQTLLRISQGSSVVDTLCEMSRWKACSLARCLSGWVMRLDSEGVVREHKERHPR